MDSPELFSWKVDGDVETKVNSTPSAGRKSQGYAITQPPRQTGAGRERPRHPPVTPAPDTITQYSTTETVYISSVNLHFQLSSL